MNYLVILDLVILGQFDYIKQLKTLSVITISGFLYILMFGVTI